MSIESRSVRKILIVDDDQEICDFLHDFFSDKGYQTFTVTKREQVLESVKAKKPDVVLLDIRLSGGESNIDGIMLLEEIKKQQLSPNVIMMTGVDDPAIIDRAIKLGASDYITKPLSLDYLEDTVALKIQEYFRQPSSDNIT